MAPNNVPSAKRTQIISPVGDATIHFRPFGSSTAVNVLENCVGLSSAATNVCYVYYHSLPFWILIIFLCYYLGVISLLW